MIDPILYYAVRIPGCAAWSQHRSEKAAKKEARRADRSIRPGHKVFAEHKSGKTTGPY
jgi:hypothetical protein